jgi:hypothetical protein
MFHISHMNTVKKEWTENHDQIIAKYRSVAVKPMSFKTPEKLVEHLESLGSSSKRSN